MRPSVLATVSILVVAACTDRAPPTEPRSPAPPTSATPLPLPAAVGPNAVVFVGAGNVARCDKTNDEQTALLLDGIPGTVFTTGDHVYAGSALSDFQNCYGPSWGRHAARTRPAPGDLDYLTAGAAGYFSYFGAAAGDPAKGYYSYDLGAWHIAVLNSSTSMAVGSAQEQWLRADLAATIQPCVLAYWHFPRFSSFSTAVRTEIKPLWDALYAAQADVVLNGHYRIYERFAPQTPTEQADPQRGLRQFTVGTGGQGIDGMGTPRPNSQVRASGVYGVLKLTLDDFTYSWQFVPIAGQTFTDAGDAVCHGRPGGPPPPNQAPTASAGGPYQAEATVTFDGSASRDIDNHLPLTYAWDFGDGTTGSGVSPAKTYEANGSYTATLVVTDTLGLASAPATAAVTIANVAPAVNAGPDATVQIGNAYDLSATFTDPGGSADAPWTWTIAWGDGASESGSTTTPGGPITASHTFGVFGEYTVRVTATDQDGGVGSDETLVTVRDPNSTVVLVGAGDIAECGVDDDEHVAQLLDVIPGTVYTLGDNAYLSGSDADFANCYHPTWGRHKARTKPVVGNHDYATPGAAGYFNYFGAAAGDPTKGYYSYHAGEWLVIVLNSASGSANRIAGSAQEQWLRALLASTTRQCAVAMMHHPQFTSTDGRYTGEWNVIDLWNALYDGGVELVMAAHDHLYERFAPMRPDGTLDAQYGIRQITAGTGGGEGHYNFGAIHPNSVTRSNLAFGVLKLNLTGSSYTWQFVPVAGDSYTDSGSGTCHGRPGEPVPNQAPSANPGGPYQADNTVTLNGSASSDPDNNLPLTYAWTFGDGTTGSGVSPTKIYGTNGSYTATLVVTDALGLSSAPATAAVTIANVAPTVNAGADASVPLGDPFGLTATFGDPGGAADAPWIWTIAWGDGNTENGSTSTPGGPITASYTYAAAGQYTVRVTVSDNDGGTGADEAVVIVSASVVLVGAGNVARCGRVNDDKTAQLLDAIPGTVFTAGDNVRGGASLSDFQNCYAPSWGRHLARTRPAPGDEDYKTTGAAGYFSYFGAAAGQAGKGYYSYDLGAWHIVVLNSSVSMAVGSAQEQWLKADLAATTRQCVLAYWHFPRFSSSGTAVNTAVKPLWDALYAAGADVVINAHFRVYERFAPQTPTGAADAAGGIRQFTVGTGGQAVDGFGTPQLNSQVRASGTYGVLKLTLNADSYSWQFVPIAGQTFTDSGTTACH
ncbi:MAG: PKD domain-containing protein [Gemmatimonadales bacterium]